MNFSENYTITFSEAGMWPQSNIQKPCELI